jgi:transcriptional regulator PpsR
MLLASPEPGHLLRAVSNADLTALVERIADVALLLSADGRIRDVEVYTDELPEELVQSWQGANLTDLVASSDAPRISQALESARDGSVQRLDLTHSGDAFATGLPMQYQLLANSEGEGFCALGTDMRPVANLRHQLINAQQALEQDYWRLRQVETRYRRLFDMVGDGVLILDGLSRRVLEANPRAGELLADGEQAIVGKVFPRGFDGSSEAAVLSLLKELRAVGRGQLPNLLLADGETRVDLVASFLRQGTEERYLLRLSTRDPQQHGGTGALFLQEALRAAPDAVLLVDQEGRIEAVNASFLSLSQVLNEEQAIGQLADRWLGRSGVDLNVLLANLREHPTVKLFASTLMPEGGAPLEVEVSACRLTEPDGPAYALFVRDIGRRVTQEHPVAAKLPRSIEQVTQRVGRVPLKELVRESTDLIEALCIETALEVTQDNRASAAELLGLSRQSLYAKLRRFNIGGSGEEEAS